MHVAEKCFGFFERISGSAYYVFYLIAYGLFGHNQSQQVNPFALAEAVGGLHAPVQIVDVGKRAAFEPFYYGVTHEFMHSKRIKVYSFLE